MTARRSLLAALKPLASHLGLHIVPSWRRESEPFANHLSRLFSLLAIDGVLDIGANRGQYRDFLRNETGYRGRIDSYEPIPDLAAELRTRSQADSAWETYGEALDIKEGTRSFSVMVNREFSSFLEPDDSHFDALRALNCVERRIDVDTITLQRAIERARLGGASRLYVKLDTQGHDLSILQACPDALSGVPALQTEASVTQLYEGMPKYSEVFDWLGHLGFDLSGIFPNNTGHFPWLIEFDAILINRRFLARDDT